ncbi:uncharacterized protein LOC106050931 isoform X2 [Biomphalaria glabrata]|nr:uncharacterized protein LOC106050931 isoform X2 [Biomphalaria glabrata]XP_055874458.1 uncharacterized protein LOC106050931 isoform X2 [Biomphalaria glabrata]XP_055874459.1 uncharacterized protein LOC106050931 isoform X2 [Biomphalaria glabrata]XP_055874460.1 uncharacterized protein LOC106050931 isoform X2 [Biomphalaria glabrata]
MPNETIHSFHEKVLVHICSTNFQSLEDDSKKIYCSKEDAAKRTSSLKDVVNNRIKKQMLHNDTNMDNKELHTRSEHKFDYMLNHSYDALNHTVDYSHCQKISRQIIESDDNSLISSSQSIELNGKLIRSSGSIEINDKLIRSSQSIDLNDKLIGSSGSIDLNDKLISSSGSIKLNDKLIRSSESIELNDKLIRFDDPGAEETQIKTFFFTNKESNDPEYKINKDLEETENWDKESESQKENVICLEQAFYMSELNNEPDSVDFNTFTTINQTMKNNLVFRVQPKMTYHSKKICFTGQLESLAREKSNILLASVNVRKIKEVQIILKKSISKRPRSKSLKPLSVHCSRSSNSIKQNAKEAKMSFFKNYFRGYTPNSNTKYYRALTIDKHKKYRRKQTGDDSKEYFGCQTTKRNKQYCRNHALNSKKKNDRGQTTYWNKRYNRWQSANSNKLGLLIRKKRHGEVWSRKKHMFLDIEFYFTKITMNHPKHNLMNNYKRNTTSFQWFQKILKNKNDKPAGLPTNGSFSVRGHSTGDNSSNSKSSGYSSGGSSSNETQQGAWRFSSGGKSNGQSGRNRQDDDDDDDDPSRPQRLSGRLPLFPSLPAPKLDSFHKELREQAERTYQQRTSNHEMEAPFQDGVKNIHGAISVLQLCDLLGTSTNRVPERTEIPKAFNICLTLALHDLSFASSNTHKNVASYLDCSTCSILSNLLKHLATLNHEIGVKSCDSCSQMLHLIVWHVMICIDKNKQRTKVSRCDLCYKISKTSEWSKEKLISSLPKLRSKIKKYCVKVLGTSSDNEDECSNQVNTEICSPNTSSSGKIVTEETNHQASNFQAYFNELSLAPLSHEMQHQLLNPDVTQSSSLTQCESISSIKLTRKPSCKGRTSLPQTIEEENGGEEQSKSFVESAEPCKTSVGKKDEMENLFAGKYGASPYDTQPTYGQHTTYVSMPVDRDLHDNTQYLSTTTSNRPQGKPGVGCVVYGLPKQLQKIASYWAKKREECDQTGHCPYQHREEGVILADYREKFVILRQRYQKNHQWQRLTHLGNGMSGKCHLAMDVTTNFRFCCKKIHLLRYCEDELTIWTEINHQFIVRLYGAIRHGVKVYIFSEFIDGGDLAACIEEQKLLGRRLSHWSAINYFKQLLDVLAYLQSKNILHEDIKADNILLRNKTTFIAVTDFGTSRKLQDPKQLKNKMPVGSPTHWSPEKASMEGHGFPSDLWAAVCVLVHMLSGWPPWVKRFNKAGILNYIIYAQPPPMDDVPHNVQEGVRKLIEKGLVKNPVLRPSPIQLLQDPAFRILDDEKFETCYSTLMSQSPRAIPRHGESCDETYDQNKLLSTTPLNVTSDKTVLYEQHISTVIHSEQQLAEKAENNEDHSANLVEVVIPAQGVSSSEMASLAEGYGQSQSDGPAQGDGSNFQVEEDLEASTIHDEVSDSPDNDKESYVLKERPHIESRICELIEPRNIENLLPAFALIYPDDGSENSLSIQQFFVDKYDDVTFNTFKDPLQFYQPAKQEPKQPARKDDPKQLPNLSIFNSSSSTSSSHVNTQERFSSIVLGQTKDMSCKDNAVVFTFSSGSDCTSSELFDMGQQGEISPPEATPNLSSTPTNLMMRKKENLKLNLGNTPPLSHSCSLPHNSNTDNESIKRPNTWTKLSSSTPKPPSQQQTPSTGRSTSSTRQGPSASTASSNIHSFFPSTKSVIEMQESVMQDMLGNLLKDPGMSSPSDNELSYETQPLMQTNDDKNYILNQFMQDIDDSALDGLKLEFFDSESIKLFDIRVTESPVYLRDVIQTIRYKVSEGFKHFTVNQLDGAIVRFNKQLVVQQFKILSLEKPGEKCLCEPCSNLNF